MEHHQLVITNIGFAVVFCGVLLYVLQSLLRGAKRVLFRTARPATLGEQIACMFSLMPEPTPVRPAVLRSGGSESAVTVKDLGVEGAFVIVAAPLPLGERVSLRLSFGGHPDLTPEGTVVWNNAGVSEENIVYRGMRVRFQWSNPEEAVRLSRILTELEEKEEKQQPDARNPMTAAEAPQNVSDRWDAPTGGQKQPKAEFLDPISEAEGPLDRFSLPPA